jgi:hypothetical protein
MRADVFRMFGEGEAFAGLHDVECDWNGYDCPWFTYETAQAVQRWVDSQGLDRDPHCHRLGFRDGSVIETDGITEWVLPSVTVDGVAFFGMSGGWCWVRSRVDACPVCDELPEEWTAEGCSCWLCSVCMTTNPKGDNACRSCRTCQPA